MPNFDWNDLRAFLAIARVGRLTVAAKQSGVDHSTLSRRVAALEAAFGTRLFDRRSTGFVLTQDGERLVADAERMESLAIGMASRFEDASSQVAGTVRLGTPEGFGTYFLAPRLAGVASANPALQVELVANPRTFSLWKREADLAVSMTRPEGGRVYARKLTDYTLGVYAARTYLDVHGPVRDVETAARHCWVGYVDDLVWTSELNYLPHVLPGLTARVRISNVITQFEAIRGGVGLGILPRFMARGHADLLPILADAVRIRRSYWLVTHEDTRDVARVRMLTGFLREEVANAGQAFWHD